MTLTEGKARFDAASQKIVTKDMGVFYNPEMRLNRDLSVLLLKAIENEQMRIADPLAGSGVRAVRFLKELPAQKIAEIAINDVSPSAVSAVKKNMKQNKVAAGKVKVSNQDANLFLDSSNAFDYIDIDPFGSPTPFLDSAARKMKDKGILAVTATDTAALCGTAKRACARKYWATSARSDIMHETGLRILIRRVQLACASHERAAIPILSYAKQHYMRVFFRIRRSNKAVDDVLQQHGMIGEAGPLWLGNLWDRSLLVKMEKTAEGEAREFLELLCKEAAIESVGFFDLHVLAKKLRIQVPPTAAVVTGLKRYSVAPTHFSPTALRTSASEKTVLNALSRAATQK